ncbi:MAG: alpha/beta hydrolase [Bacteroidota bacterium]
MTQKLLSTSRGSFHARLYGSPQKPPLILLHGWPQTGYCWHHATPYLQDYYVICPDLRGMGDSNRELNPDFYHKDQMAQDIFAIADELGIDSFFLGGHDWGGAIVQEMAFRLPERIKKLVIINMVVLNNSTGQSAASKILLKQFFRSSWYQFFLSIKDFPEAMISGKEEIWVRFFSRGISKPIPEDAIEEYIRCYKIPHTITTAANLYRTLHKDRKRWEDYLRKKIHIPTQFIHGVLDPVIIKEYLIGVEEFYPNIEITHLNGGHFIVDEQPEAVGIAISEFLLEG